MNYHVRIRAQVEWSTSVDADSPEEAEEKAKDDFEDELDSEMNVECFNDVTAFLLHEPA